jgi:hypothetical protein
LIRLQRMDAGNGQNPGICGQRGKGMERGCVRGGEGSK